MTQKKVRALSSSESEFFQVQREIYCHETGEQTKTLVLHCDSLANRGMVQQLGWEMPPRRGEMDVVTTNYR